MNNLKLLAFILFINFSCFSQTEYVTNQGVLYKVGDTLQIGRPISISGSPINSAGGHWKTIFKMNDSNSSNSNLTNKTAVITKIEIVENIAKFYFRIYSTNFYVKIEEALAKGEIINKYKSTSENKEVFDKYDKLKKIKQLYDSGALTKDEFDTEKKKILDLEK